MASIEPPPCSHSRMPFWAIVPVSPAPMKCEPLTLSTMSPPLAPVPSPVTASIAFLFQFWKITLVTLRLDVLPAVASTARSWPVCAPLNTIGFWISVLLMEPEALFQNTTALAPRLPASMVTPGDVHIGGVMDVNRRLHIGVVFVTDARVEQRRRADDRLTDAAPSMLTLLEMSSVSL